MINLPPPHCLKPRQWDTVYLMACDKTNGAIAAELGISVSAVQHCISRLKAQAYVTGRVGLVIRALRMGWIRLEEIELGYGGQNEMDT